MPCALRVGQSSIFVACQGQEKSCLEKKVFVFCFVFVLSFLFYFFVFCDVYLSYLILYFYGFGEGQYVLRRQVEVAEPWLLEQKDEDEESH